MNITTALTPLGAGRRRARRCRRRAGDDPGAVRAVTVKAAARPRGPDPRETARESGRVTGPRPEREERIV